MILIAERYGVRYHVSSVYKLMRRLGYGLRTPYPEDPRGDPGSDSVKFLSFCSGLTGETEE